MGLLAIGLALSAASTVAQAVQGRKAARARREARAVSTAGENIKNKLARRKSAREERVRRATLIQASENSGTAGSSGEIGAISSLGANFASVTANQQSAVRTATGISAANQRAEDAAGRGRAIKSFGSFATGALGMWDEYKNG